MPTRSANKLLLSLLLLAAVSPLAGCMVAGVSSSGHFFIFPGIGIIVVVLVVLLLLRRR